MKKLLPLLLCAACAHTPAGSTQAQIENYYPLAVGHRWTYRGTFLGQPGTREVSITARTEDGFFRDNQQPPSELRIDAYGLRDRKRYLLRTPIQKGTAWTNVLSISSVERYQIADADVTATVAAGRFDHCVLVVATNRLDARVELVNELTFAPGVGLVRVQTLARIQEKGDVPQMSMELVKFEAGGGGSTFPPAHEAGGGGSTFPPAHEAAP